MAKKERAQNRYEIDGAAATSAEVRARVAAERAAAAAETRARNRRSSTSGSPATGRRSHRRMSTDDKAASRAVRARMRDERASSVESERLLAADRRRTRQDEQDARKLDIRARKVAAANQLAARNSRFAGCVITARGPEADAPLPSFRRHEHLQTAVRFDQSAGAGPAVDSDGYANLVLKLWSFGTGNGRQLEARAHASKLMYVGDPPALDGPASEAIFTNMVGTDQHGHVPVPGSLEHNLEISALADALSAFENDAARSVGGEAVSQHFSHIMIALPACTTRGQRRRIATKLTRRFAETGVPYFAGLHRPSVTGDQRNHHLHIVVSTRRFVRIGPREWSFAATKNAELLDPLGIKIIRADAVEAFNAALSERGLTVRFTALTRAERGLDATANEADEAAKDEERAAQLAAARARIAELDKLEAERLALVVHVTRLRAAADMLAAFTARTQAVLAGARAAIQVRKRVAVQARLEMLRRPSLDSVLAEHIVTVIKHKSALEALNDAVNANRERFDAGLAEKLKSARATVQVPMRAVVQARLHILSLPPLSSILAEHIVTVKSRLSELQAMRATVAADAKRFNANLAEKLELNGRLVAERRPQLQNLSQRLDRFVEAGLVAADRSVAALGVRLPDAIAGVLDAKRRTVAAIGVGLKQPVPVPSLAQPLADTGPGLAPEIRVAASPLDPAHPVHGIDDADGSEAAGVEQPRRTTTQPEPIEETTNVSTNSLATLARAGRIFIELHESGDPDPADRASALPLASLRVLSSLGLVQHDEGAAVLLRVEESDGLDGQRGRDHELRRAREGGGDADRAGPVAQPVGALEIVTLSANADGRESMLAAAPPSTTPNTPTDTAPPGELAPSHLPAEVAEDDAAPVSLAGNAEKAGLASAEAPNATPASDGVAAEVAVAADTVTLPPAAAPPPVTSQPSAAAKLHPAAEAFLRHHKGKAVHLSKATAQDAATASRRQPPDEPPATPSSGDGIGRSLVASASKGLGRSRKSLLGARTTTVEQPTTARSADPSSSTMVPTAAPPLARSAAPASVDSGPEPGGTTLTSTQVSPATDVQLPTAQPDVPGQQSTAVDLATLQAARRKQQRGGR